MYKRQNLLRTIAVCGAVLVVCSMSPVVLAWKGDTLSPWVGTTFNGKECKGEQVPFGPYDYLQRASLQPQLEVVEETHFSETVENLVSGQTTSAIGDIHYTLSAWPNHHRALNSAMKYRLQHMGNWPDDSKVPPAECYLQRAMNFSPNDPKPYIMYGLLMHKIGEYDKALGAYRTATRLLPNDIITQYNMGLTLVELKQYDEAKKMAEKVYAAGFPLPGLKKKLIAAGQWKNAPGVAEPKLAPQAEEAAAKTPPATTEPSEEKAQEPAVPEKVAP